MKWKSTMVLVLAVSVFLPCRPPEAHAFSYSDGETWNLMTQEGKAWLVMGFYEGARATDEDNFKKLYSNHMSFENIVATLNEFYSDRNNLKVTLPIALHHIKLRADTIFETMYERSGDRVKSQR